VIVQNFRAKPDTVMAEAPEPDWTSCSGRSRAARILLGPDMNHPGAAQPVPGRLSAPDRAGINDWGGISPVTPDHVNPEAPWPEIDDAGARSAEPGRILLARLPAYPAYARAADTLAWIRRWPHGCGASPTPSGLARADAGRPAWPLPDRQHPNDVLRAPVDPAIAAITACDGGRSARRRTRSSACSRRAAATSSMSARRRCAAPRRSMATR
jgi:FO synthase